MLRKWFMTSSRGLCLAALAAVLSAGAALAQTGQVEGTVRNAETGDPIADARVAIVGADLTATTNENGYYMIANVPVGTYSVRASVIGYQPVTITNQAVTSGLPATVNFALQRSIFRIDAVVVTGVTGETQRAKLPFTVDQVTAEDLPVPRGDALSALQGKVAGAIVMLNSGQPGTAPTVLLRGPTSIDASGRGQEPLYVVDGVIVQSSMADIDALDIEEIEVVKGAAASSLYGSRAQNGVIVIKTRRGASLPQGEVRFSARSEFGANQLPGRFDLTMHHQYLLNADGTKFVQRNGVECDWLECGALALAGQDAGPGDPVNSWNTYVDQPWPGQAWDQVERLFEGGNFSQQYLSAEGRAGNTNFHASWSNLREQGVMTGQEGMWRNNFRVNVDQSLADVLQVSASAFYSRSKQDLNDGPLFDLTRMPAGADLLALNKCPETGSCPAWAQPRLLPNGQQDPNDLYLNVNPQNTESPNPLYAMFNDNTFRFRGRFLASANVRWSPLEWLALDGDVSYDRLDRKDENIRFKGFKTINPSTSTNLGGMSRSHLLEEALNASVNLTLTRRFGDLATRTQFRYLAEYDDRDFTSAGGSRFTVADVPTIGNLNPDFVGASSFVEAIRADGYYAGVALDYKDRYILDALVRNDGSSLFGPDERRHWYFRVAGAWRLTEDMTIGGVDELKLRAAYGTAGGRPRFEAQYETYSVGGGTITKVSLGNRNLKPELSKEFETGIDALLFSRVGLALTYARTETEDQILRVPLTGYAGFSSQWRNAGTLESNTWEATLDLQAIRTPNTSWTWTVLFDRTRQKITELNVPPFAYGVAGQALGGVFFAREGEEIGKFYGQEYATSCDHLLGAMDCSEFAVNDDGLLVWVGPGGSLDNPQWGTTGPSFGFNFQGRALEWGSPFVGWSVDPVSGDTTNYVPIGKTTPDYHLGVSTTYRWRGLSLYGLLEYFPGITVYNQPQQWAVFRNTAGIEDQTGVPEGQKKPVGYYERLYGVVGLTPVNFFVQDASFAKLREVRLSYRFSQEQLQGVAFLQPFSGVSLSLIGRNVLTFSPYNGYDPETGRGGGNTSSAALARVDGYDYPNFRSFTAAIEVNF